jgi:hypothetical protein
MITVMQRCHYRRSCCVIRPDVQAFIINSSDERTTTSPPFLATLGGAVDPFSDFGV